MKPFRSLQSLCLACLGRFSRPGSRSWLVEREIRYGGYVSGLERHRLSDLDTYSLQWDDHSLAGGDRMNPRRHNYGPLYARYLRPFVESGAPITLVEVGVLRGTGLAIWSDLFPDGRIIGLDIDLTHFESNLGGLLRSGAFKAKNYEVHLFDGFMDNSRNLSQILQGKAVDIVIDDASHADESVLATFESIRGHLARNFVYFVEDNKDVHSELNERYPQYRVEPFGEMTVVTASG